MLNVILFTLGGLILLEGLLVILFPKVVGKSLRKISNKKKLKKAGFFELIAGLILLFIGMII
jgi:uncharacterized protein YjeT (DUF2065 family)